MLKRKSDKCSSESTIAVLSQAYHPLYLGDPPVIEGLLRPYVQLAADQIGATIARQQGIDDASEHIETASAKLATILLGEDEHYRGVGQWNTGGVLPAFLRAQYSIEGDPDDRETLRLVLAEIAVCMTEIYLRFAKDPTCDWKGQIDDLIATFTRLFIGIPLPCSQATTIDDDEG